jgi:dienelactone hydrolase
MTIRQSLAGFLTAAAFAPALTLNADPALTQAVEIVSPIERSASGAPRFRLSGFAPGEEVRVSYFRTPPDGARPAFGASATYIADDRGEVAAGAAPESGDWAGSEPEAPFWVMAPVPDGPLPPVDQILIRAETSTARSEATYHLPQPPNVIVEPVDAFPGAFLARPADAEGPLPLIIVLGGSEGNDGSARHIAPRLASEGYAALGLPYYSPNRGAGPAIPGLPTIYSEIPVDRLEQVYRWTRADPRIDSDRIGLWGVSKGGEFAILAASTYDWLDAVAAIVPSDVVWEGFGSGSVEATGSPSFSLHGRPIPFVPYGAPGRRRDAKDMGRWRFPARAAAARIPIERFRGLLLVAGGGRDEVWDSAGMSQNIAERRAEAGLTTVSLIFPDAGHNLAGRLIDPIDPGSGGSVEGEGRARLAVWAATVALFRTAWGEAE